VAGWDIDPDGVRSVLVRTAKIAEGLDAEVKSYGGHIESAATAAGTLSDGSQASSGSSGAGTGKSGGASVGLVGVALSQFAQARESELQYLAERTGKSLQGAVDATKAYLTGDLQMAQNAQSNALADPNQTEIPARGGRVAP
jgi:hypothetical protein